METRCAFQPDCSVKVAPRFASS